MRTQGWSNALMIALTLAVAACGADLQGPITTPVGSVVVSPDTLALGVGATQPLAALVRAPDGTTLTGRSVQWTSADEQVARVSAQGLVTGIAPGATTVTVSSGDKHATATILVHATNTGEPPVASVQLWGDSVRVMQRGTSTQLIAIALDSGGNPLNGIVFDWSSSDESVAWVTNSGGVVVRSGGSAIVTATADGKAASVHIKVPRVLSITIEPHAAFIDQGTPLQLTATVMTEAGAANIPVQWTSETPQIAVIDAHGRVTTAVRAGIARIRATAEGVSGYTIVNISGVRVLALGNANGQPLPTPLHYTTAPDTSGAPHQVRVVVVDGLLRFNADGTYWHQLLIHLDKDGEPFGTRMEVDTGTVMYHFMTGMPLLVSSTHEGRVTQVEIEHMHGLPTGDLTVLDQLDGEQVRLFYRQ